MCAPCSTARGKFISKAGICVRARDYLLEAERAERLVDLGVVVVGSDGAGAAAARVQIVHFFVVRVVHEVAARAVRTVPVRVEALAHFSLVLKNIT